jgi:hypothetical protein
MNLTLSVVLAKKYFVVHSNYLIQIDKNYNHSLMVSVYLYSLILYSKKDLMYDYYLLMMMMNDYYSNLGFVLMEYVYHLHLMFEHFVLNYVNHHQMIMMKLFLLHRYILDVYDRQYHVYIMDTMYLHHQSKRLPHLDL